MRSSLFGRIARSLVRDLVVPWVISAICIALFLLLVFQLSLLAWPVCCGIFLFLCVQRRDMRSEDGTQQRSASQEVALPLEEACAPAEPG